LALKKRPSLKEKLKAEEEQSHQGGSAAKSVKETPPEDGKPGLIEVKNKLREIFEYYASFGDRLNTTYLKS